ncbi:hypothetical protein [Clostridium vincentii]|uniref:Uncharacterized protein n=1 Tax=Clostridium vincentii TaxID=52704 RepID=A0A2T0BAL2_9CLOT|nr:hypothetical protein [Clostridium vincentii]PRR80914.1 hypothetical protein CLVI_29040 [Clostridium vincentii]
MLDKITLNSLNIEGKNTIKDFSGYKASETLFNNMPSNEISNFIINSNLENGDIIK